MIIKRNSIHYRLYNTYSKGCPWDLENGQVNFCKYSRNVMVGVLSVIGIILGASFVLLGPLQLLGTSLLWLFTDNGWMSFIGGTFPGTLAAGIELSVLDMIGRVAWALIVIETIIVGVVTLIVGGCHIADKYNETDYTFVYVKKNSEPGFIRTWYRSWKDKYCPMVEMEKDSE